MINKRKEEERQERKIRILKGALSVFRDVGIEKTTMDEIAVEAGVGKATIIDGTGPYKNTKGAKCLYAISFHEEIVFTNIKCNLEDELFNQLKN